MLLQRHCSFSDDEARDSAAKCNVSEHRGGPAFVDGSTVHISSANVPLKNGNHYSTGEHRSMHAKLSPMLPNFRSRGALEKMHRERGGPNVQMCGPLKDGPRCLLFILQIRHEAASKSEALQLSCQWFSFLSKGKLLDWASSFFHDLLRSPLY